MKALIMGGGIGGLATAIALQQQGFEVAVYEQAPEARVAGAGITLWANAVRVLEALGVLPELEAHVTEAHGGIFSSNGTLLSSMDSAELKNRYGAPTIALHRSMLLHALLKRVGDVVRYGKQLATYTQNTGRVYAHFTDGTEATGDLLIGADGIHSRVRLQMHPQSNAVYQGYGAWRAVVNFPHQKLGGIWGETWGRGTRFGIVPIANEQVYWFATVNRNQLNPPEDAPAILRELFGNWHAPIPALLEATPAEALLYNPISDLAPLTHWVDGRVVLLGDAAHAMTPNLGQGGCQALEDAYVLGRNLGQTALWAEALARYEAQRRFHTDKVVIQSRRIGQVGQWAHPMATAFRNALMRLTPTSATLRQLDFILEPTHTEL